MCQEIIGFIDCGLKCYKSPTSKNLLAAFLDLKQLWGRPPFFALILESVKALRLFRKIQLSGQIRYLQFYGKTSLYNNEHLPYLALTVQPYYIFV